MPTGKVKWYDTEKGFGFLTRDDGGDVFVHQSALPPEATSLRSGQRVEFGVAEGRRGQQALSVRLIEQPQPPTRVPRKPPDEMVVIVEDLIRLLDDMSTVFRRGKYPDSREAHKVASVLRAVAKDLDH